MTLRLSFLSLNLHITSDICSFMTLLFKLAYPISNHPKSSEISESTLIVSRHSLLMLIVFVAQSCITSKTSGESVDLSTLKHATTMFVQWSFHVLIVGMLYLHPSVIKGHDSLASITEQCRTGHICC